MKHIKSFGPWLGLWAVLLVLLPWMVSGDTTRVPALGAPAGLTIGTTTITGGATQQVLFNLGGVVSSDADMTFATDTLTITKITGGTQFTGTAPTFTTGATVSSNVGFVFGSTALLDLAVLTSLTPDAPVMLTGTTSN